eukprot:CAMPEP_0175294022 /NCGR_PEP_ID=MMETSP0093-20121207/57775_1 /TAXON_ID=311494 /ORGANISM="Alexandrium monilatum, Strain CCMP3105" /LENGTH=35 /DNA_ID= /DNA_START= /DNA_END= /DNA_ORIENTATION=
MNLQISGSVSAEGPQRMRARAKGRLCKRLKTMHAQ